MRKTLGLDGFTSDFRQTLKEKLTPNLNSSKKIKEEETLPNSFHKVSIILISKSEKDITRGGKKKPNIADRYL